MTITLNNSNISVTYNTGSNYIIETVKSDLYVRGTTSGNLSPEPTVSPSIRSDIVVKVLYIQVLVIQRIILRIFHKILYAIY